MNPPPCVTHLPGWITGGEAGDLLAELTADVAWEQREITVFGRTHPVPRLTCWYGETTYTYAGVANSARPLTDIPVLDELRARLEAATGATFNSCLANQYRSGADGVGWHSDDEPGLGDRPTIASISLGSARDFRLRHQATRDVTTIALGHGDLLVMRDESQTDYRHCVPKRARVNSPRINLTFRSFT